MSLRTANLLGLLLRSIRLFCCFLEVRRVLQLLKRRTLQEHLETGVFGLLGRDHDRSVDLLCFESVLRTMLHVVRVRHVFDSLLVLVRSVLVAFELGVACIRSDAVVRVENNLVGIVGLKHDYTRHAVVLVWKLERAAVNLTFA